MIALLALSGCAERAVAPNDAELAPDRVLSRIDDLDARPEWLKESEPFVIDSDRVVALGTVEIPAGHRIDAAYRIAENNARGGDRGSDRKETRIYFSERGRGDWAGWRAGALYRRDGFEAYDFGDEPWKTLLGKGGLFVGPWPAIDQVPRFRDG